MKDLWGELPITDNVRTPYTILKEQASFLTQRTDGLLIGEVVREIPASKGTFMNLRIKAPSLNNYHLSIIEVRQVDFPYPVIVSSEIAKFADFPCKDEDSFERILRQALSASQVKKVIAALLSEIRADELTEKH